MDDEHAQQRLLNPQYTLPVIVRQDKGQSVDFCSAAQAVATGIASLLSEETYDSDPAWADTLEPWLDGQFRKVVRRARGAQWDALTALPHLTVGIGDTQVRFIAPHPVEEVPQLVKRLQVSGLVLDGDRIQEPIKQLDNCYLHLAVADLGMSDGKTLAQIGHGVQLAIQHGLPTEPWYEYGAPIVLREWGTQPRNAVAVVDAGLTEIAPGSHTVAAWVE